jgi:hypothetical protein
LPGRYVFRWKQGSDDGADDLIVDLRDELRRQAVGGRSFGIKLAGEAPRAWASGSTERT